MWSNKHIRRLISARFVIAKDWHSSKHPVEDSKSEVRTRAHGRIVRRTCENRLPGPPGVSNSDSCRCCRPSDHTLRASALNKPWDTGRVPQSCSRTRPLRTYWCVWSLPYIRWKKQDAKKRVFVTKCKLHWKNGKAYAYLFVKAQNFLAGYPETGNRCCFLGGKSGSWVGWRLSQCPLHLWNSIP